MTYFWGGMKRLHNTEDRRVLMERMKADSRPRTTLSFYRYVHLDRPERTRAELYEAWSELEVLGRTYVAKEGITLSDLVLTLVNLISNFLQLSLQFSELNLLYSLPQT